MLKKSSNGISHNFERKVGSLQFLIKGKARVSHSIAPDPFTEMLVG